MEIEESEEERESNLKPMVSDCISCWFTTTTPRKFLYERNV
jgi:hypothetical protein